jgi:uncharacterized protein
MSQENVELLQGNYEAFGRGDIDTIMGTLAEDIAWSVPEVLPHGVRARAKMEVAQFFRTLLTSWEDFRVEVHEYVASGERVCVIGRANGRHDGEQKGYGFVHAWTVRDGLCVRFDEYVDPDPELVTP